MARNGAQLYVIWATTSRFAEIVVQFVFGILTARLLSPDDYGLIGIVAVVTAIAKVFSDAGFTQALVQRRELKDDDVVSVFWLNIILSLVAATVTFALARPFSFYFARPELEMLLQVFSVVPIVSAIGAVQRGLLLRKLDIKWQFLTAIVATSISGVVGLSCALVGFGFWSLVVSTMLAETVRSIVLWIGSEWRPTFRIKWRNIRELWAYSSGMFATGLLNACFENVQPLIIARSFTMFELGLYNRARSLSDLPVGTFSQSIGRIAFPSFSKLQNDLVRIHEAYRTASRQAAFIFFPLIIGLSGVASTLIECVLSKQWLEVIPYLQLIAISSVMVPLDVISISIIKACGRSDRLFWLECSKRVLMLCALLFSVRFGIFGMLIAHVLVAFAWHVLNGLFLSALIDYPIARLWSDVWRHFASACFMGVIVWLVGECLEYPPFLVMCAQASVGVTVYLILAVVARTPELALLRDIVLAVKGFVFRR